MSFCLLLVKGNLYAAPMKDKNNAMMIWGKYYSKSPLELISWNPTIMMFETVIDSVTEIHPSDSSVFRYPGNSYDRRSCRRYTAIRRDQVSWGSILAQYDVAKVPRVAGCN